MLYPPVRTLLLVTILPPVQETIPAMELIPHAPHWELPVNLSLAAVEPRVTVRQAAIIEQPARGAEQPAAARPLVTEPLLVTEVAVVEIPVVITELLAPVV